MRSRHVFCNLAISWSAAQMPGKGQKNKRKSEEGKEDGQLEKERKREDGRE